MALARKFWSDERGATSIEYGMIGAGLSILCIVGARLIGDTLNSKWLGPLSAGLN